MKQLDNNPYSAHQEILLLLPWYVNKTLHGAEAKRVENHLQVCLVCKRELITLHRLAEAVQQEGALDSAVQVSFSRLKKRIHGSSETSPAKVPKAVALPGRRQWYGKLGMGHWRLPQPVFALAAVLLLSLLVPRFIATGAIQMNKYRTLSNAENPVAGQNTISVIFADEAKQSQINQVLASVQGRIVDGPTAQGVYTIAVGSRLAAKDVLDRVASMRKSAHVIFAEPAYALLSSVHAGEDAKQ